MNKLREQFEKSSYHDHIMECAFLNEESLEKDLYFMRKKKPHEHEYLNDHRQDQWIGFQRAYRAMKTPDETMLQEAQMLVMNNRHSWDFHEDMKFIKIAWNAAHTFFGNHKKDL